MTRDDAIQSIARMLQTAHQSKTFYAKLELEGIATVVALETDYTAEAERLFDTTLNTMVRNTVVDLLNPPTTRSNT